MAIEFPYTFTIIPVPIGPSVTDCTWKDQVQEQWSVQNRTWVPLSSKRVYIIHMYLYISYIYTIIEIILILMLILIMVIIMIVEIIITITIIIINMHANSHMYIYVCVSVCVLCISPSHTPLWCTSHAKGPRWWSCPSKSSRKSAWRMFVALATSGNLSQRLFLLQPLYIMTTILTTLW